MARAHFSAPDAANSASDEGGSGGLSDGEGSFACAASATARGGASSHSAAGGVNSPSVKRRTVRVKAQRQLVVRAGEEVDKLMWSELSRTRGADYARLVKEAPAVGLLPSPATYGALPLRCAVQPADVKLTVVPGNDADSWAGFLDYNYTSNEFPYGGTYGGETRRSSSASSWLRLSDRVMGCARSMPLANSVRVSPFPIWVLLRRHFKRSAAFKRLV